MPCWYENGNVITQVLEIKFILCLGKYRRLFGFKCLLPKRFSLFSNVHGFGIIVFPTSYQFSFWEAFTIYLTREEEKILSGDQGPFKEMCMKWLTRWGEAMHAKRMGPVQNVHALFTNQGNCIKGASVDIIDFFFKELTTACKEKAKCYTATDVSFISDDYWRELNFDETQVEYNRQLLREACGSGFFMNWTCVPYFIGSIPLRGEICAWAESSCIHFVILS